MTKYFVRFPNESMRLASRPMLDSDVVRFDSFYPQTDNHVLIADLSDQQLAAAERNGAKVYEDVQFEPLNPFEYRDPGWAYWDVGRLAGTAAANLMMLSTAGPAPVLPPWQTKTLHDVLDHIKAPQAWETSRGAGVTIGIVDTGISSAMPEFPAWKRSPHSKSYAYANPWEDPRGHGSMCACIAAASQSDGGRYNGVAPDAMLMSLRTSLSSTDIYKLYDWVLTQRRSGALAGPVVLSNSYGLYSCSPWAGLPEDHPYREIVLEAIRDGITVVFAAGNNHYDVLCNHDPAQCSPNTIWGVNSLDEVLSVGTVNWQNRMDSGAHGNSSRGPGQWASSHPKPDCVAPTYGEVIWGSGYQTMEWWGTSGACPQVAGLAALLLSAEADLTPADVADLIRNSCDDLGLPATCAGSGLICCERAVAQLAGPMSPARKRSAPRKPVTKKRKAAKRTAAKKKPVKKGAVKKKSARRKTKRKAGAGR